MDDGYRRELLAKLEKTGVAIVAVSPEAWQIFAVKPLWLAPSPMAPLASVLESVVQENLDFEIENQKSDGSWTTVSIATNQPVGN